MPSVSLKRSDKFPVGTVVGAYRPIYNRHFGGKPSGTAVETATVDATGTLTFPALPEGVYALWGLVEGNNANMQLGNVAYTPPLPTLRQRIARKRVEVGA